MAVAAVRGELCGEGAGKCTPDRGGAFGTRREGREGFGEGLRRWVAKSNTLRVGKINLDLFYSIQSEE